MPQNKCPTQLQAGKLGCQSHPGSQKAESSWPHRRQVALRHKKQGQWAEPVLYFYFFAHGLSDTLPPGRSEHRSLRSASGERGRPGTHSVFLFLEGGGCFPHSPWNLPRQERRRGSEIRRKTEVSGREGEMEHFPGMEKAGQLRL